MLAGLTWVIGSEGATVRVRIASDNLQCHCLVTGFEYSFNTDALLQRKHFSGNLASYGYDSDAFGLLYVSSVRSLDQSM
jgi:hypothetical protein